MSPPKGVKRAPKKSIPVQELMDTFHLVDGKLYWIEPGSGRDVTRPAGSQSKDGYMRVMLNGVHYLQHRVIFAMVYGYWPDEIDHINSDKSDNRPQNLREASRRQNMQHCTAKKNNTSGAKGVSRNGSKWRVRICTEAGRVYLGDHNDLDLAKFIYECAAEKYHGQFARTA